MATQSVTSDSQNGTTDSYPKVTYTDGMSCSPASSAEHQLLMNAVSTCAYQLIQQLLEKKPDIVHEKGWHGQTVLHKACLIGDYETCRVLLHYGADPNAKNDYDETPLHYACKRGQPTIIHMLVQQGGDLDAVDKNGNSMCHHAAQTGSVYSLAYLHTQRPRYHTVNNNLQLPLHIACQFGHVDAFAYLLKKEKNDIKQADKDGNNVLHIAAKEGHQGLAWAILKTGGCELLHMVNKDGDTPDDITSRRDKYGHKVLAPILSSLRKHKPKDFMVTDPKFMFYWILFKPFIIYVLLLILCHAVSVYYQPGCQGYVMVVGLIVLIWDIGKHLHRLNHISRMQNPVFAGAFGAGLTHTTIHYFVFVHSSVSDQLLLRALSYIMMSITFYMYYTLLTRDPGRVRHSEINPATQKPVTVVDLCSSREKVLEYCTVCEIAKPVRTKHCRLCEVCYAEMDHHCLFLLTCIAKNNHVLFVWFLIACVVSMVIYEVNLFLYLSLLGQQTSFISVVTDLFHNDAWTLSLGFANFVSILWGANLVKFQLQIVSKGQLTAIQMYTKKQSGLTSEEKLWNIVNFLRFKPPYAKDPYLTAQNLV